MDEVLRYALGSLTHDQFRGYWLAMTKEQQFHLVCAAIDVAQSARVLHREYARDDDRKIHGFDYNGIAERPWPEARICWEDLGYAVGQFFGKAKAREHSPRPPFLTLDWGESVLARCNIPRHGPAGVPQAGL